MTAVFGAELRSELTGVGEVAVVDKDYSIGRIDVKRLRFLFLFCVAPRRVANVTQPDRAEQAAHIAGSVALTDLAPCFVQVQGLIIRGRYTGGILASVLEQRQSVIHLLVDRCRGDDAHNSAH